MAKSIEQASLMMYLKRLHPMYHGKVLELRDAVAGWLEQIPETFPHFTRHTAIHSEEIVFQLSEMLFADETPNKPVVSLSAVEAYVLIAAAYLHDTGMVVSDAEKVEILSSDAWKGWTSGTNSGAKRLVQIEDFRRGRQVKDVTARNFIADMQLRFLVAEFVRLTHHERAGCLLTHHQSTLGRFAFDDNQLQSGITNVCVAHGLSHQELEDSEKYPDRRDIRGEKINIRFMAMLLRIGDLLDMSNDRACPLLLNGVCPLPPESLAHWTQYQRITHRMTAPDRIEILAECKNQEEHRVIQDWCQWLVDEVNFARTMMAKAARHREWNPPETTIGKANDTLIVRPATGTSYVPSQWVFVLDNQAIFDRLVKDVYRGPLSFVKELIQNALDATRCQMYLDIRKEGMEPPEYPTQVGGEVRERYPVKVFLKTIEVVNELSGEKVTKQVVGVEDAGIGMDKEIIERYFLQVGRSYYKTDEFKRSFGFVPTSRFGIGFLSVFGVSDRVHVETFKPSSASSSGPIRLTLTGPRNYLLHERGRRQVNGTSIEVVLSEPLPPGALTAFVANTCKRVEFPIVVEEKGVVQTIVAEKPESFTCETPDVTQEGAKFIVRSFPVNKKGIEGELYVLAHIDKRGESWADYAWAQNRYRHEHPQAFAPDLPESLTCFHGIGAGLGRHSAGGMRFRIDIRGAHLGIDLSRTMPFNRSMIDSVESLVLSRWAELMSEHLVVSPRTKGTEGWVYKQRLVDAYEIAGFWDGIPETIRVYVNGEARMVSLDGVRHMEDVISSVPHSKNREGCPSSLGNGIPFLSEADLPRLSVAHRKAIFAGREIGEVWFREEGDVYVRWHLAPGSTLLAVPPFRAPLRFADLPQKDVLGFSLHATENTNLEDVVLNRQHSFVAWFLRTKEACMMNKHGLRQSQFDTLLGLVRDAIRWPTIDLPELNKYLRGWRGIAGLPADLRPPDGEITEKDVRIPLRK